MSDQAQTVTVSQRPERDFCNAEDPRTADDTSSHLRGCTGEHVPSLWLAVGQMYRCRLVLSLQKVLVKHRAIPQHATGLESWATADHSTVGDYSTYQYGAQSRFIGSTSLTNIPTNEPANQTTNKPTNPAQAIIQTFNLSAVVAAASALPTGTNAASCTLPTHARKSLTRGRAHADRQQTAKDLLVGASRRDSWYSGFFHSSAA